MIYINSSKCPDCGGDAMSIPSQIKKVCLTSGQIVPDEILHREEFKRRVWRRIMRESMGMVPTHG
jgi:hypothetical protein